MVDRYFFPGSKKTPEPSMRVKAIPRAHRDVTDYDLQVINFDHQGLCLCKT